MKKSPNRLFIVPGVLENDLKNLPKPAGNLLQTSRELLINMPESNYYPKTLTIC